MKKNPRVLRDLLNEGVSIESIRKIWSESEVKTEVAQNSRSTCRICGRPIKKGEERVVSEDSKNFLLGHLDSRLGT